MGFGFVVARFGFFLRELAQTTGHPVATKLNASAVGVALVAGGVALNVWATIRHRRLVRRLHQSDSLIQAASSAGVVGIATALAGAALVAVLINALANASTP